MSVRGRIISEPRLRPDGFPLEGERTIHYRFKVDNDPHAIPAATKVFEQDFLKADSVDVDALGSRLTFSLREFVTVELGATETGQGHDCTCGDYDPQSPCSVRPSCKFLGMTITDIANKHVYWAWDHVVRTESFNHTNNVLSVGLTNHRGVLTVVSQEHGELDPIESIGGRDGLNAVQRLMGWRADPSLNKDEKLTEFVEDFKKCRSRAERYFLSMYQPNHLEFPHISSETYSGERVNRHLDACATDLLRKYTTFSGWLERLNGNVDNHESVIDSAVATAIVMMRGVLLRPELRYRTMRALGEEEDGSFWSSIQQFFDQVRLEQITTASRNALAALTLYIRRQLQQPINAEHVILNYFNEWFND